jgi:hypothetical protein
MKALMTERASNFANHESLLFILEWNGREIDITAFNFLEEELAAKML